MDSKSIKCVAPRGAETKIRLSHVLVLIQGEVPGMCTPSCLMGHSSESNLTDVLQSLVRGE